MSEIVRIDSFLFLNVFSEFVGFVFFFYFLNIFQLWIFGPFKCLMVKNSKLKKKKRKIIESHNGLCFVVGLANYCVVIFFLSFV